MSINFDPQSISITIDLSLEEYRAAMGEDNQLGIHFWESMGDRSKTLRFRHEHAHFTSFMGSGLADLYGIISDYKLVFLYSILKKYFTDKNQEEVELPLILSADKDRFPSSERQAILNAWQQINQLSNVLFGFGGNLTLNEITNLKPQNDFWNLFYDVRFDPIVQRYIRLINALSNNNHPMEEMAKTNNALPLLNVAGRNKVMTTRSVMETYAITIELFNTYFRGININFAHYSDPIYRNPGPHYTVAIEYALEELGKKPENLLQDFLRGQTSLEYYYLLAAMSFAAMQVPVFQAQQGEVFFKGSIDQLCPAYRFVAIVQGMKDGTIPPLPENIGSRSDLDQPRDEFLGWLTKCHQTIGDEDSMAMYETVKNQFETDKRLLEITPDSQTLIELSWAARANFYTAPNEFVLDAGLFAEYYPCQIRYVRTSDHKLIFIGAAKTFWARYIDEHSVPVFEAAVFAEHWEPTWTKMPELELECDDLGDHIMATYLFYSSQFGYENVPSGEEIKLKLRL